jgi:hypothetical protein
VCPACQKKASKQQQSSKKTLSSAVNKRTSKALGKKQSTQIYDFIQQKPSNQVQSQTFSHNGSHSGSTNQNALSVQISSASVQQKRKFQKNRSQMIQIGGQPAPKRKSGGGGGGASKKA